LRELRIGDCRSVSLEVEVMASIWIGGSALGAGPLRILIAWQEDLHTHSKPSHPL